MRSLPGRRAGQRARARQPRPARRRCARWSATWRGSCGRESALDIAAGAAPLRGAVRHPQLAPGAEGGPAAGRLRRVRARSTASTRDPAMSARGADLGLQDRPRRALGRRHRERAARLQIPLYILAVRELLGIEPVAGLYRGAGRQARGARHGRQGRDRDAAGRERPAGRGGVLGAGRPRRRAGRADRPADARRRRPPRPAPGRRARSGACGGRAGSAGWRRERARLERGPARGDRTAGPRVRVGGRRHRQDGGAGRAGGAARAGGHAARPPAGDHVHRAGGGRAQGPRPRAAARARSTRTPRRRSTRAWISTIHGFCAPGAARPRAGGRHRPDLRVSPPRPRRGSCRARRSRAALERFVAADGRPPGSTCWRSTAAARLRRMVVELHERLRGTRLAARAAAAPQPATCLRRSPTWTRAATALGGERGAALAACSGGDRRRSRRGCSTCVRAAGEERRNDRAALEAIDLVQQAALDVHCGRRPGADRASCCALFDEEYAARQGRRAACSTSTTSSCAPATCCARGRTCAERLPRAVRRGDGRRVPGHQPAAGRAGRAGARRRRCSWSATSSRASTGSAGPTSRSTARCAPRPADGGDRARPQLPLPAARARPRQRGVRPRVRRAATSRWWPAAGSPASRPAPGVVEVLLTDRDAFEDDAAQAGARAEARRDRRPDRRAGRGAAAAARARWCCCSRPAPTPASTRTPCGAAGCAPCVATGRGYYGQREVERPADLPAAAAQPHRRRGAARACWPRRWSACRTTGWR